MLIYIIFISLLITLPSQLKGADLTYANSAQDREMADVGMGINNDESNNAQYLLSMDMRPDQRLYRNVLRSQKDMQQILPSLDGKEFVPIENEGNRERLLSSGLERWRDIIDILNWVGGIGSDAFYAEEMSLYITKDVRLGVDPQGLWKKKPFYSFRIKPEMEEELDKPAFLSQESARHYLVLRSLHGWLVQHLEEVNMGLETGISLPEEESDLLAFYFERKHLWPLERGPDSYLKNLERLREMIQLGASGGFDRDLEEVFFTYAENALYQIPSEEMLAQEQQLRTDQEGSSEESLPIWSWEKINTENAGGGQGDLNSTKLGLQAVQLFFQQDCLSVKSQADLGQESGSREQMGQQVSYQLKDILKITILLIIIPFLIIIIAFFGSALLMALLSAFSLLLSTFSFFMNLDIMINLSLNLLYYVAYVAVCISGLAAY